MHGVVIYQVDKLTATKSLCVLNNEPSAVHFAHIRSIFITDGYCITKYLSIGISEEGKQCSPQSKIYLLTVKAAQQRRCSKFKRSYLWWLDLRFFQFCQRECFQLAEDDYLFGIHKHSKILRSWVREYFSVSNAVENMLRADMQ